MERKFKLTIKNIMEGSRKFEVDLPFSASVADLKTAIFLQTRISSEDQALIYRKCQLKPDDSSLESFGIVNNSIITMNAIVTTGLKNSTNANQSDHILEAISHLLSRKKTSPLSIMDSKTSKRRNKRKHKRKDELQLSQMSSESSDMRSIAHETTETTISSESSIVISSRTSSSSSEVISDVSDASSLTCSSKDVSTNASVISMDISEVKDSSSDSLKEKCKCQQRQCKKRLSLTEQTITCRCAKSFCLKHRGPENHACPIDYKRLEQDKLRKENPKVDSRTCDRNLNW